MAPQRQPRFTDEELRVMVEEIVRVEPQLFGTQIQYTSIARRTELCQRIVDRVNAVGQHPRNREDIRKRWNDLRGKVRSMVSRHNIAVQKTGGGPPPQPPQFTSWEEEVLNILHPDGLAGVGGGMDTGPDRQHTAAEGPELSTPPTQEAVSDDSSSVDLDTDDQPGPSGTSGQSVPLTQAQATTDPNPSGNTSTAPTQRAHASVSRARQSAVCLPLQGTQDNPPPQQQQGPGGSGSGHTGQGAEAQGNRTTRRAAVRQGGEERPREPTLHEVLTTIMGAYNRSQETMATVLARFQEIQVLQEEHYRGYREDIRAINTTLVTMVGLLQDLVNSRADTEQHPRAPATSLDQEQPSTSAGASGQEAPAQQQPTRPPPPAGEEPPRKRALRSRKKTE
ncbi:hypothetical protein NDU88_010486 [Pleurodeles waltl]|uniref:Myb/SANT-like DNA-binding domain-containing protein n=1 Tax=Pleurodeles waltl TaxID=8319 RepID=A0AAV7PY82_PLEWA|nr:hypothetical protein NDU88_010486 [Pleurodeles waltl]